MFHVATETAPKPSDGDAIAGILTMLTPRVGSANAMTYRASGY